MSNLAGHCIRHKEEMVHNLILWTATRGKRRRGRQHFTIIEALKLQTDLEDIDDIRLCGYQVLLVACYLQECTILHAASICICLLFHTIPIFLFLQIRIIYHRLLIISNSHILSISNIFNC